MEKKNIKGCGIIPFAIYKNNVYFLLGKSKYYGLEDLGGKRDKYESVIKCAVREFNEETVGLFKTQKELIKIIKSKYMVQPIMLDNIYLTYLIKVKYDPNLTDKYKLINQYMKNHKKEIKYQHGYFEMDELVWVNYNQLNKILKKGKIRPRTYSIFKKIINKVNLSKI